MACTSGCPTPGRHASWGECARSKRLQVTGVEAHAHNKRVSKVANDYATARAAGLQPDGIGKSHVARAWAATEATGTPYRGDAQ